MIPIIVGLAISFPFIISEISPAGHTSNPPDLQLIDTLVEFGCSELAIYHLMDTSNLLDEEYDGVYYQNFKGLPDGLSQEDYHKCVEIAISIRESNTTTTEFEDDDLNSKSCPQFCPKDDGPLIINVTRSPEIVILDDTNNFDLSKITKIKPNTMEFFYYPNPEDTTNRDAFQKFILIRLPVELGGAADDISSFKAYSALSISSHCLSQYRGDEGRKRIEDPCHGSLYRIIDGLLTDGPPHVDNTGPIALPHLDLSIDENGSLFVEPPTWTLNENGVVGEGRHITLQEIRTGSQFLIDSFKKSHSQYPHIPLEFAGLDLINVIDDRNRVLLKYSDSLPIPDRISANIGLSTASDQAFMKNKEKSNIRWLQIGDTTIRIGGNILEKNNEPKTNKEYEIQFIKDGYNFGFNGQNLEFMKKEIVSNYFPEFEYTDLIEEPEKSEPLDIASIEDGRITLNPVIICAGIDIHRLTLDELNQRYPATFTTKSGITYEIKFLSINDNDLKEMPVISELIKATHQIPFPLNGGISASKGLVENPDWNDYRDWYDQKKAEEFNLDEVRVKGFVYNEEYYSIGFSIC